MVVDKSVIKATIFLLVTLERANSNSPFNYVIRNTNGRVYHRVLKMSCRKLKRGCWLARYDPQGLKGTLYPNILQLKRCLWLGRYWDI